LTVQGLHHGRGEPAAGFARSRSGKGYDLFHDEEPLECGLENPEVCEACE